MYSLKGFPDTVRTKSAGTPRIPGGYSLSVECLSTDFYLFLDRFGMFGLNFKVFH